MLWMSAPNSATAMRSLERCQGGRPLINSTLRSSTTSRSRAASELVGRTSTTGNTGQPLVSLDSYEVISNSTFVPDGLMVPSLQDVPSWRWLCGDPGDPFET